MILGPGSGMDSYAGHPLVGTLGVPLVLYPGLKVRRYQGIIDYCADPSSTSFDLGS